MPGPADKRTGSACSSIGPVPSSIHITYRLVLSAQACVSCWAVWRAFSVIEVQDMKFLNTDVWLRRLRGVLLVLVFISVFLYIFSLNFRTPSKMDVLQRSVTETVSPPILLFGKVFSGFEEFFQRLYLAEKSARRK